MLCSLVCHLLLTIDVKRTYHARNIRHNMNQPPCRSCNWNSRILYKILKISLIKKLHSGKKMFTLSKIWDSNSSLSYRISFSHSNRHWLFRALETWNRVASQVGGNLKGERWNARTGRKVWPFGHRKQTRKTGEIAGDPLFFASKGRLVGGLLLVEGRQLLSAILGCLRLVGRRYSLLRISSFLLN